MCNSSHSDQRTGFLGAGNHTTLTAVRVASSSASNHTTKPVERGGRSMVHGGLDGTPLHGA